MSDHAKDLDRKLGDAVERMPAFPRSVQKILELTRNLNCSPKDLVQVIEKDPVMTVRILRVLNSAYYSLPNKITSVNHAVVFLGLNTIKNLALSIASVGILPRHNTAGFDVNQYLLHSLTTAGIAKYLSSRIGGSDPMDCYVAGLLHDFGKVVFAQFMPEQFKMALDKSLQDNVPLFAAEMATIGTDHTVVGSMLAEKWQFPQPLIDSIRNHHSEDAGVTVMGACVFAANEVSKKMRFGYAGSLCIDNFPASVGNHFGDNVDELIVSIGDGELSRIAEEARLFSQMEAA